MRSRFEHHGHRSSDSTDSGGSGDRFAKRGRDDGHRRHRDDEKDDRGDRGRFQKIAQAQIQGAFPAPLLPVKVTGAETEAHEEEPNPELLAA